MKQTLFAAVALVALMPTASFAQHPCLRLGQIYNWKALNDKTLIVEDQVHRKFKLNLVGVCSDLQWHQSLAFRSIGGSDISCLERGDTVISRELGIGAARCAITNIEPYTADMEHADREAASQRRSGY